MKFYVRNRMKYLQFPGTWRHFFRSISTWPEGYVHIILTLIKGGTWQHSLKWARVNCKIRYSAIIWSLCANSNYTAKIKFLTCTNATSSWSRPIRTSNLWLKKIIFKSSMVLYKSSVFIQPSNFSIVERKLIWFYKRNLSSEGCFRGSEMSLW